MSCVYQIINDINNKRYIGKTTKTISQRFKRHWYDRKRNTPPYNAIRKYGKKSFSISVLEETNNLDVREQYWISQLRPEYNLTRGGEGGDTSKSPNYCAGMLRRDFRGSRNPHFGKHNKNPMTDTRRENIRLSRLGKPHPHRGAKTNGY